MVLPGQSFVFGCLFKRKCSNLLHAILMPAERSSYHTLVVKVGLRFSNARQQPMWISRLEARVRRQNESIAELEDDLPHMSQRAYSSLNNEAKEMLTLNQLYESVSPELKYKCISKNCTSVTQAVSIIELYEAILEEDSAKNLVCQATAEPDRNLQAKESFSYSRDDNNLQGILRQLQNCIEMLSRQCNTQTCGDQGPRDRNGQRPATFVSLHVTCKETVHIGRETEGISDCFSNHIPNHINNP